jgi:3-polyprenyl-4-hydroxybenzoate decarboxylase
LNWPEPLRLRGLQHDSIFTKGSSDVLDHATSEIASGSKLGIDATKKIPGEGFKRPGRHVGPKLSESEGPRSSGWMLR